MSNITQFQIEKERRLASRTKVCKICKKEKSKDLFTLDPRSVDKRYRMCHDCKAEYNRNLYKNSPKKFRGYAVKWERKNKEKVSAHKKVVYALKTGKVEKSDKCEICGTKAKRLDAHHWKGYDKNHVLDVQWLCRKCHKLEDRK